MIWLILSIGTSSLLYVIFKGFEKYHVNTLHAIVVNYLVAAITGFIAFGKLVSPSEILSSQWIYFAGFLGLLFIVIFNFMALTSQKNGLSVAAIASKMSLIIPVVAGIWLYNEPMGWVKILGVILAMASVYLASIKQKKGRIEWSLFVYPVIVFLGSGTIDTVLKYVQEELLSDSEEPLFSATCFLFAFMAGAVALIYETIKGRTLKLRSIVAGVILGVPNYFSIYFIIRALNTDMASSTIFPINHVGTVLLTTALGMFLFHEKMNRKNYWGVALAVLAILVIAFAKA